MMPLNGIKKGKISNGDLIAHQELLRSQKVTQDGELGFHGLDIIIPQVLLQESP